MAKVEFPATFHGVPARGRLTFEPEHRFAASFTKVEDPKVSWAFRGTWRRLPGQRIELETSHGYARIVLGICGDRTLTGISVEGGFIDLNIVGSRSTQLPEDFDG